MILRIPPVSRRERLSLRSLVMISTKDYPNLAESISAQGKLLTVSPAIQKASGTASTIS